jgi:anti-anti-sigma regulatory factor
MTNNMPTLLVAVVDQAAIVKVNGRANFTTSVSFKRLVGELRQRGYNSFILDLTECITMDSTFLGVLAGTALKLSEPACVPQNGAHKHLPDCQLRLLNPNQRVADLLDNLGISDLFRTVHCQSQPKPEEFVAPAETPAPSREELSKTCLEAHRLLMDLNPANVPKFKEVTQFLAEDLKHLRAESTDPAADHNVDKELAANAGPRRP